MNPVNKNPGIGKTLAGMLVGFLLAVVSPILMMTQMLSLTAVIMLPAVAVVALNRWAGKGPALFSAMLQLMFSARFLGDTFMWMSFFLTMLPVTLLIRNENKPFFTQIKLAIAAFGGGVVLTVFASYLSGGGDMVEGMLLKLPKMLRTLPAENVELVMQSYVALLGQNVAVDEFYQVFDQIIQSMILIYEANLPGLIFSGALVSAVLCVGLNGLMRTRQGIAAEGTYLPLREWALPASATGGILLILAVSFAMSELNVPQGETVFFAVYDIALAAFCIQALGSIARRLHESTFKPGVRTAILVLLMMLCVAALSIYMSIYGVASAVFGSKGLIRNRMQNENNNNHSDGTK